MVAWKNYILTACFMLLITGCAASIPPQVKGDFGVYQIDHETYKTGTGKNSRVRFLVLHYTALNFEKSIEIFTNGQTGVDYLVPDPDDPSYRAAGFKQLRIFNLVDEQDRAWHAGLSAWQDRTNLNDTSIGIEIVNQATDVNGELVFPHYPSTQIDAVAALAKDILARYPDISPMRIVGHSDIAYTRKNDPGPRFPWFELYQRGVGVWYEPSTMKRYMDDFRVAGVPSTTEMQAAFKQFGYSVPDQLDSEIYRLLVRAFQMRFRPSNYDGQIDLETAAILFALNERYQSS